MLNPNGTDASIEAAESAEAARARAARRPLSIDPSWRAGRKLEEARRQLGLGIDEVAQRIRVRREFLEALEAMNAKLLPGKAYALAYLRSYARVLGLDEQALVEQFQEECALSREDAQPQIRQPDSRPHAERPWLLAAAVVALAAGFVGWQALTANTPAPAAATAPIASRSHAPAEAPAAPSRQIEIRALSDAWLEVRGPDGTVFLSRMLRAGETYHPDASAGWTVHARDGGAFAVRIDGAEAGPLGDTGVPVLGRQLDSIEAPPPPPVAAPRATVPAATNAAASGAVASASADDAPDAPIAVSGAVPAAEPDSPAATPAQDAPQPAAR